MPDGPSGTGHDTAASERVLNRVLLCPHRKDCLDNGCTGCCEQDPPLCRDGSNATHRAPDQPPVAVPGPASPARVPCPNCGATDATRGSGRDAPCDVCAPGPASVSPAEPPRCSPLCGAIRAYGVQALQPSWWWKHEALCPMREHLHRFDRERVAAYHGRTSGGMEI